MPDKNHPLMRPVQEIMPSERELERLYDEHASALFAFLLNLTRDEADTRDCLQEVFVKLVRKPSLLDGVHRERAYLLRLAHNQAIDLIRRRDARDRHHSALANESVELFATADDPDEAAY